MKASNIDHGVSGAEIGNAYTLPPKDAIDLDIMNNSASKKFPTASPPTYSPRTGV